MSDSRLKMYARTASGAAALAAAGVANADIITSTGPTTVTQNAGSMTLFAFGSIGVRVSNVQTGAWSTSGLAGVALGSSQGNSGFRAMAVASGATIDSGLTGNTVTFGLSKISFKNSFTKTSTFIGLTLGTDNLLALNLSSGSERYYGWINYSLSRFQGEYTYTINSWAYNDVAGQGIIAGQNTAAGSAVVPGLSGLAALAIGAAGVRTRRQRIA